LGDALQEIRELSAGLVIPDLKELPLVDAIRKVIERHEKRTSTEVEQFIGDIPFTVSLSTKICIYRFVQEGLNNAFKHGKGIDQSVSFSAIKDQLIVSINDKGPGMSLNISTKNDTEHLGLRGLRERVESIGGKFELISNQRYPGVKLLATLPI
jgi:signal transduction histidine kinase